MANNIYKELKNEIKYIYFDLDGTLLDKNKKISLETIEYINKLKDRKIKYGIITGRSHLMVKNENNLLKPDLPFVCINGGIIFQNFDKSKQKIKLEYINSKTIERIKSFLLNEKISFMLYSSDKIFVFNNNSQHINFMEKLGKSHDIKYNWAFKKIENKKNENHKIIKILIPINQLNKLEIDKIKNVLKKEIKLKFVFSQSHLIDILPKDVSKGAALKCLARKEFINLNNTIVFGDQDNDISMFKEAKYSACLKNGSEGAKKASTFTTEKDNNNNGVLDFLKNKIEL